LPDRQTAFIAVLQFLKNNGLKELRGETEIFIFPGYEFKVCDGLITNFHQPGSTLILLVAALVGNDWQKIYNAALENDYRFLSYGDSSLLLR
jgi:S-adenosylmethionine:tRNA ribosyltransferase-isomerase